MTLLIVLLPALNFLLMLTFSRVVHWKALAALIVTNMVAAMAYLVFKFPAFVSGESHTAVLGSWVHSGLFEVNWTFSIDALTYTMLIVVLTVSTLVHLYSTEYMSEDPHINRFISYLSLFTFFMLILITADNFVTLFLGWEGVGLCSYLLISFWFTRIQASKAAIKAMVVNRIADLAFTVGMSALFYTFQTTEFNTVFGLTPYFVETTIPFCGGQASPVTLIAVLLFLGAMGKSAQIGLHTWLPDAMEGPTPVSALIHAATMVTAGVFLLIRCSGIYEFAPSALELVTIIGASTAFMAATSGLLQNDLKKVIAYSTCSQLGYMVFACGLSSYALSLFHLANHAFFKALLFLSAGAVIHGLSNEQDMRRFGGLIRILPYTYAMFVIGSLALMGFPFLTGFYSKDLILEVAASTRTALGAYSYLLGIVTALFTAYYSFRLLNLVFYGTSRSPRTYLLLAHELTPRMALALAVLSIGSIFFGYFFRDLFVGLGTVVWAGTITQLPETTGAQLAGEFLALLQKIAPLLGCVGSVGVIFLNETAHLTLLSAIYQTSSRLVSLYRFLSSKWGFDAVYNQIISNPMLRAAYNITFSLIDKGVLEIFGPTGGGKLSYYIGTFLVRSQTGRVYEYAAFMVVVVYLTLGTLHYFSGSLETTSLVHIFFISPALRKWWAGVVYVDYQSKIQEMPLLKKLFQTFRLHSPELSRSTRALFNRQTHQSLFANCLSKSKEMLLLKQLSQALKPYRAMLTRGTRALLDLQNHLALFATVDIKKIAAPYLPTTGQVKRGGAYAIVFLAFLTFNTIFDTREDPTTGLFAIAHWFSQRELQQYWAWRWWKGDIARDVVPGNPQPLIHMKPDADREFFTEFARTVPQYEKRNHELSQYLLDKLEQGNPLFDWLYKGAIYALEGTKLLDAYQAYLNAQTSGVEWHKKLESCRVALRDASPSQRAELFKNHLHELEKARYNFTRAQEEFHTLYEQTCWGSIHLDRLRSAKELRPSDCRGLEYADDAVKQARAMAQWYENYRNKTYINYDFLDGLVDEVRTAERYAAAAESLNNAILYFADDLGFPNYVAGSVPPYFGLPLVFWYLGFFLIAVAFTFLPGEECIGNEQLKGPRASNQPRWALPYILLTSLPLDSSSFSTATPLLLLALPFLLMNSHTIVRRVWVDHWRGITRHTRRIKDSLPRRA